MSNRADDFNRADDAGAIGTPSGGGSAWVTESGTWGVSLNGARLITGTVEHWATLDAGSSAVEVQATIRDGGANCGLCARVSNQSNGLLLAAYETTNQMKLFKLVGGSYTQLGSTYSGAVAVGDVLKLRCDSSNALTCYLNGVARVGPVTDSAGSSNTKHGLRAYNDPATRFDDFSITDLAAGATVQQKLIFFSRQAVNRSAMY